MTYDFTQVAYDFDGKPLTDEYPTGEKDEHGGIKTATRNLTYALMARAALLANEKDEGGEQKFKCYEVALKISANPSKCDLKDDERQLLREKAGRVFPVMGAGALKVFLDNPIPNMTNLEKVKDDA